MSLRERIQQEQILVAPGAYDGLTAKLITLAGFEAVYLTGAGVSYSMYGTPDMGVVTATQMIERVRLLADATTLPIIADGDTGYGNAINVMHTVRQYELVGASAIQLEDQQFPKRCGHLSGKELIDANEMVGKIQAAIDVRRSDDFLIIARTDARSVLGLSAAIDRALAYAEAGADLLFVESPRTVEELEAIATELAHVPLVANMVEGGKTPLLSADDLQAMGYSLVIFPNSLTRHMVHQSMAFLTSLRDHGTTTPYLEQVTSFTELNTMLGLEQYKALERKYLPEPDNAGNKT
jgi:2-methylisocitrate lyase-like PEP mutase family enzyme